jgi:DnaJ-domain-containing protein 1
VFVFGIGIDLQGVVVYAHFPAVLTPCFNTRFNTLLSTVLFTYYAEQGRMKDYYAALGIDSDASLGAIKTAYRKKASEFHPDKNTSPDAPARFREVQEAYDLLSDEQQRRQYDENRQRSLLENPVATAEQIWTTYMHKVLQ